MRARMIKKCLKFLLCIAVYAIVFILASGVMPFSQGLIGTGEQMLENHPANILFMLAPFAWNCFAVYFIIRHTHYSGIKLFTRILYVMFFVVFFITNTGAMYSLNAFDGDMTALDMILTMITGLLSLLATIPILMKFFQNKGVAGVIVSSKKIDIKTTLAKLGLCGIVYLAAYFLFAYFFQWRFEEFRMFYAYTPWGQAAWGGNHSEMIPWLSITIIRGILNGFFILPMLSMIDKNKITFITGICLIYIAPAVNHLTPTPMFPDTVRIVHLVAMTGSMLLFGIIMGNILWGKDMSHPAQRNDGLLTQEEFSHKNEKLDGM